MTMSLANAIKDVRKDEHWIQKVLGCYVLYILGFLPVSLVYHLSGEAVNVGVLISAIISIVALLFLTGFIFKSANNAMNNDTFKMAEFSDKNLLLLGLKTVVGFMVFSFWAMIVIFALALVFSLIFLVIFAAAYFILSAIHVDQTILVIFGSIAGTVGSIAIGLYFGQYFSAAMAFYIKTLNISKFFALKEQIDMLKDNQHAAWTLIGKNILYSLLFTVIVVALCVSIIGMFALPFVFIYAYFVCYNLLAQYAKEVDIDKYLKG